MPPRYDRPVGFLRGFLGVFFPRLFNLFGFFELRLGAEEVLPP
jgi:hypothetical protein